MDIVIISASYLEVLSPLTGLLLGSCNISKHLITKNWSLMPKIVTWEIDFWEIILFNHLMIKLQIIFACWWFKIKSNTCIAAELSSSIGKFGFTYHGSSDLSTQKTVYLLCTKSCALYCMNLLTKIGTYSGRIQKIPWNILFWTMLLLHLPLNKFKK